MDEVHNCDVIDLYKDLDIDVYNKCDFEFSDHQYAALDAHIDNLELPFIAKHTFCSVRRDLNFCIKSEHSLKLSILAIIGTYTQATNLLFFTSSDDNISEFLSTLSNMRLSICLGSIINIEANKADNTFKVISYNASVSQSLSESNMMKLVTDFIDRERSITFYLDSDLNGYATHLHNNKNSMWVSKSSGSIQLVGDHGSRIMPMLYMYPSKNDVLRLNVGRGQIETQNSSTIESQINAVISDIMSALSKDNLCYCCAYMKKIHSILCPHSTKTSISFEAPLLVPLTENSE